MQSAITADLGGIFIFAYSPSSADRISAAEGSSSENRLGNFRNGQPTIGSQSLDIFRSGVHIIPLFHFSNAKQADIQQTHSHPAEIKIDREHRPYRAARQIRCRQIRCPVRLRAAFQAFFSLASSGVLLCRLRWQSVTRLAPRRMA